MAGGAPSSVLSALNVALLAQPSPDDSEPRFLTATYAQLRLGSGRVAVQFASAGDCPMLIRRADGPGAGGGHVRNAARLVPGRRAARRPRHRRAGDSLILHSDGVTEARRNGEMFGDDGVAAVLDAVPVEADAATLAECIEQAVLAFGGAEPADDMAVLVIRVP